MCLQANSEIAGYRVTYGRTGEEGPLSKRQAVLDEMEEEIVRTGPASRRFRVDGLLPRTSYTFNVEARNVEDETGPSATIIISTETPQS